MDCDINNSLANASSSEPPSSEASAASQQSENYLWQAIAASVRGTRHTAKNQPNQDAVGYFPERAASSLANAVAIVAVADGHGSAPHFRSDAGAALAVKTALSVLNDFVRDHENKLFSEVSSDARLSLPRALVQYWYEQVEIHITQYPFSEEGQGAVNTPKELDALSRSLPRLQNYIPYGSTLLAVVATPSYLLCLQLGDGDIVTVDATGRASLPMPVDERLTGDESWSLCLPTAVQDFRVVCTPIDENLLPPKIIFASTDGLLNSYVDQDAFLEVGKDILRLWEKGPDALEAVLPPLLAEASRKGSADDTSIVALKRIDAADNERLLMNQHDLQQNITEHATTLNQIETTVGNLSTEMQQYKQEQAALLDENTEQIKFLSSEVSRLQKSERRNKKKLNQIMAFSILLGVSLPAIAFFLGRSYTNIPASALHTAPASAKPTPSPETSLSSQAKINGDAVRNNPISPEALSQDAKLMGQRSNKK